MTLRNLLYVAVALGTLAAPAFAQDPVADAEARKKIAEAERDVAAAERDRLKARLGEISTDRLPKGEAKTEGLAIEGTILGYSAGVEVAKTIAGVVHKAGATKVVLYSPKEIGAVSALRGFTTQADILTKRTATLLQMPVLLSDPPPADCKAVSTAAAFSVAPLVAVDAALQLLALVKVDRSATGMTFTADEFAIYAALAQELKGKGIQTAYPPLFQPYALQDPPASAAEGAFAKIVAQQNDVTKSITTFEQTKAKIAKGLETEKRAACKPLYQADITVLDSRLTQLNALQKLLDQFVAAALKADDQSGLTLMQTLNNAEQLRKTFGSAHLLQVKPVAAGGTTHTRTNLFGSKIYFSGGVVIAYMLLDKDGVLTATGTIPLYEGFVNANDMPQYGRKATPPRK